MSLNAFIPNENQFLNVNGSAALEICNVLHKITKNMEYRIILLDSLIPQCYNSTWHSKNVLNESDKFNCWYHCFYTIFCYKASDNCILHIYTISTNGTNLKTKTK